MNSVSPGNNMWDMQAPGPPDLRPDSRLHIVHTPEYLRKPTIEKPDLGMSTRAEYAGSLFLEDPPSPTPVTAWCSVSLLV